jgi:type IX secretion system substrate protein
MKSIYLQVLLLFSLVSFLSAQSGINILWEKEFRNDEGPEVLELHATSAGSSGTVVVGLSSTQEGVGMYIAKYQTTGQIQWDTTLTTSNYSLFSFVKQDNQGNYYAVGTEIVGSFIERHIHIAKISGSGQVQWRSLYKGPGKSFANVSDLKVEGNNFYLCGSEPGGQGFDVGWVAKFDLSGVLIWESKFAPTGIEISFSNLTIDNTGTVTVVGSADFGFSFLALQYNSNGSLSWQYPATLSGGNVEYLMDVVADNSGNVYAVGTEETGSFVEDIVTLKLSNTGTLTWKKSFNNGDQNSGSAVRIGPGGNIYTLGNKQDNFDYSAIAIVYNPSGTKLWDKDYNIDDDTEVVDAEVDGNGDLYIGVQGYDSLGIVKFSSGGAILADMIYGGNKADYLSDISLSGTILYATGYKDDGSFSSVFSLQASNLSENFVTQSTGIALSNANPGLIVSDGGNVWLSTFSDDGDTAVFAIIKMDASGTVQWERSKKYATSIPSYPYLSLDGMGNVIGLFQNNVNVSGGHIGIIKYDASGVEQFTVLIDSSNKYAAGGLAIDNVGNIYITGYNAANKKMFLSRYNSSGVHEWTTTYTSPSVAFPYAKPYQMQYTAQGNLVIAAVHKGANDDNELHLFQYDTNGSLEWHTDVDNQAGNTTYFAGMNIASNGDITIFGSSTIGTYVAARFDLNGGLIWDDKGTSPVSQAPRSMAVDMQGNTYLCFSTNSNLYIRLISVSGTLINDNHFSVSTSGNYYFPWHSTIVNNELTILGQHLMPGGGVPFQMIVDSQLVMQFVAIDSLKKAKIQALALDPNDFLYGAYLTGNLSTTNSYRGALVRKYTIGPVGISNLQDNINDIRIYPNPAKNQLTVNIDLQKSGLIRFDIFDLHGRLIVNLSSKSLISGDSFFTLQLPASIENGAYFLGITHDNTTTFKKLMILR